MSYKLAGVIWNDNGTLATDELTPLEALERIKKHTLSYDGDVYKTLTNSREMQVEDLDIIEKALKALEIIKTKKVAIKYVCGEPCLTPQSYLTDEEYDLLKEVLL